MLLEAEMVNVVSAVNALLTNLDHHAGVGAGCCTITTGNTVTNIFSYNDVKA